ncbi:hypothetical protein Ddc_10201 [Ditylenchus destructor]|nr:hypothetical protein Ddc_10201 [Ditylenchus destructor]
MSAMMLEMTQQQKNILDNQDSQPFLTDKSCHKDVSIGLTQFQDTANPTDIKEKESLKKKLDCRLKICAYFLSVITFTVTVYFLIWYNTECWVLPFQENPCKQPRALPLISTNQSTLADTVDEFTIALRSHIAKFRDTIEMPHLADRQALSSATKNEIGQLFSDYSADLIAFRALKREDWRLTRVEAAIGFGYSLMIPLMFLYFFPICVKLTLILSNGPKFCKEYLNKLICAGEKEKPQEKDDPLRWWKKCVRLMNFAIFICIAAECILFYVFVAGQYYGGTSPILAQYGCTDYEADGKVQNTCPTADFLSYSTKLQVALNKHFAKLDSFMASAIELRQGVWLYEIDAIEKSVESHLELKEHDVDRRKTPREIEKPSRYFVTISAKQYEKPKVVFKELTAIELSDSEDPKKSLDVRNRIQRMECLANRLAAQRDICARGLFLAIIYYFFIWYLAVSTTRFKRVQLENKYSLNIV